MKIRESVRGEAELLHFTFYVNVFLASKGFRFRQIYTSSLQLHRLKALGRQTDRHAYQNVSFEV
jgi:hypothetical protein